MACGCDEDKKVRLLYSCSGAANTGFLADQVWRKLMKDGTGSGTCLSAVGADLSGFLLSAANSDENIIIDGCPVGCGKKIFESKKLPYNQILITDYNVKKGKTEITPELIELVTSKIRDNIG
ncbi:MAG: putative zinc-binding protein [Spirochaetaceae bacterium]|nr:putative zinc-binding protein [Spirochaetaceae bacterium]